MCGRYSNHVKAMLDWSALLGDWPEEIPESHNIAPGQNIAGFTSSGGFAMRWGLIPSWSDDLSGKYSTFNARIETVAQKPAYRHAWRASQRCLIPALGYYEWQKSATGKQPFFIYYEDFQPLFFAGLYEPLREPDIPMSCTMLTRPAREDLIHIHPRMPVVVSLADVEPWLQGDENTAETLVTRVESLPLHGYPVSTRVNNARNEGDDLIQPLDSLAGN